MKINENAYFFCVCSVQITLPGEKTILIEPNYANLFSMRLPYCYTEK